MTQPAGPRVAEAGKAIDNTACQKLDKEGSKAGSETCIPRHSAVSALIFGQTGHLLLKPPRFLVHKRLAHFRPWV